MAIPLIVLLTYFYTNEEEMQQKEKVQEELRETQTIKIQETPAQEGASYFENVEVLEGQEMYYAYPLEIDPKNPPQLIIYSPGKNQTIVQNKEDEYMQVLRENGEFFVQRGYAFAASNEHGNNWGGEKSLKDIQKTITWLDKNYYIADNINMVGFSMGGLSSINFAVKKSDLVNSIALLAPTPNMELTQEEVEKIEEINIKIFQGTQDPIHLDASHEYVNFFEKKGKDVELEIIEGEGHYDIQTSVLNKIYKFFEKQN